MRNLKYCFLSIFFFVIPKDIQAKSELTYFRSIDSAYNYGRLDIAKMYTEEAMQWARKEEKPQTLSKFLIKYISILIEQDYTQRIDIYYDSAFAILTKMNNAVEMANLWNVKARHLMYNQKYDEARSTYQQVEKIYAAFPKDPLLGYFYNDIGYLEDKAGNYELSTSAYINAINIFEQANDSLGLANTYGNLARTYFNLQQYTKAVQYAQLSLNIRLQHQEIEGIIWTLALLTEMYLSMNNKDFSDKYKDQYIHYAKASNKKPTLIHSYTSIAKWHAQRNQFSEALINIQEAIHHAEKMRYPELATYYINAANYAAALKLGANENKYLKDAQTQIHNYPNHQHALLYHQEMVEHFKRKSLYDSALSHLYQYIEYKNYIFNEQKHKQISQLEIAYETQKKQTLLEAAIASKSQQQIKYNFILGTLILLIIIAIFLFTRYRWKRKIEAQQLLLAERNRISAELHDEVGSAISAIHLIAYKGVRLHDNHAKNTSIFHAIHQQSKQVMDSINDIVWSLHPANEKMDRIIEKMKSFANEVLESVDMDIRYEINLEQVQGIKLSPEKRKDLYLCYKEAINNIAKYSKASLVIVRINIIDPILYIQIQENGIGFNSLTVKNGNGLNNMKYRMQRHGGDTLIESSPGNGSVTTFQIFYAS